MSEESERNLWPINFTQKSVKTLFTLFTVFWWIGYPLSSVVMGFPFLFAVVGAAFPFLFLVAASVFDCIILYRHWILLQGHGARTTPGKAVGFGFIPFYCFYWWFVAYAGLAEDNNRYMESKSTQGPRLNYGLAITLCVLGIASCTVGLIPIPIIGFILAVPSAIIGFLFVLQQRNCILAIMKQREQVAQPAHASDVA